MQPFLGPPRTVLTQVELFAGAFVCLWLQEEQGPSTTKVRRDKLCLKHSPRVCRKLDHLMILGMYKTRDLAASVLALLG